MLRVRNIVIVFVLNYMVILVTSTILEMHVLSEKAQHIQTTLRTAGDMALQQTQVLEEFMHSTDRGAYQLLMPSSRGDGFVKTELFEGVFNLPSENPMNKERIFDRLYNNNDFKMLATRTNAMRTPIKYWNSTRTGFDWYYIPKVAMIGTDILPPSQATTGIKDARGSYVTEAFAQEIFSVYRMNSPIKTSGGVDYFHTPLSFGVTYINEDLLSALFMNNMDLMMRHKYKANLQTPEGGNGVLKGSTFSDHVTEEIDRHNPINDGTFTLLRGRKITSSPDVALYEGVKPLITYKVIDMYDSANDQVLVHLFGAKKGSFNSKAAYLKDLDRDILNPVTLRPYDTKPIVVAKVTFYADIVVPYTNLVIRELRAKVGLPSNNFIDMSPESPTGVDGTRRIEYTRYFAVTP